jgi:hypothetical protein
VTKRSDSIVRRMAPVSASIWWILRARYSPTQRPLGPGQARVAAVGRRRDRGDDLARARIDLLDPAIGELPQVSAVEGGAALGDHRELADHRAARGVEGDEALAAGEPDVGAVEGHPVDLGDAGIGAVLAEDLGLLGLACGGHGPRLPNRQRARE